jgi:hypothetical protein
LLSATRLPEPMAAGRRRLLWIAKAYGTAVRVDRRIFLFFNYFENLYDYFEIYQNKYLPLWARRKNPTVVGHGGRTSNRRDPRRQGHRQRSGAGCGPRGTLPPCATAVGCAAVVGHVGRLFSLWRMAVAALYQG